MRTTHKTVKLVIGRRRAGEAFDVQGKVPKNTDAVATVIAEKVLFTVVCPPAHNAGLWTPTNVATIRGP